MADRVGEHRILSERRLNRTRRAMSAASAGAISPEWQAAPAGKSSTVRNDDRSIPRPSAGSIEASGGGNSCAARHVDKPPHGLLRQERKASTKRATAGVVKGFGCRLVVTYPRAEGGRPKSFTLADTRERQADLLGGEASNYAALSGCAGTVN